MARVTRRAVPWRQISYARRGNEWITSPWSPAAPASSVHTSSMHSFDGNAAVETSQFKVRKDEGRMVLVSSVSGPPHDVRRWVSHLAARPEIESVSEE